MNAHHTQEYVWVDSDGKGGWKVPSGKGQMLIVLHAGSAEGWVPGGDLMFRSKTNSADYHDEMNSEHFMEWFTKQLLPNIPDNAVIVVDNATYHNKQKDKAPTTAKKNKTSKTGWTSTTYSTMTRTLKRHYWTRLDNTDQKNYT